MHVCKIWDNRIWPSIRFDVSLQNFKKPLDIFSPKIERKAFQRIFCYNSGCERKLWAIFLPQVHLRRHSKGTRSLTHSLTHSILINLFIKVKLNTLLLPPLLSITFVPSAFYAYVWHILEGTSKAYIFSRHKRVASRRWVLYKWKYSNENWQYHMQEMDLELLKGRWNNWAWIIVVYLHELCTFVLDITWYGEDAIDRSVKELSKPDDGISFSEKRISQRALAAKKRSSNCKATLTFTWESKLFYK